MTHRLVCTAALMLFAAPVLAQAVDEGRARQLAGLITEQGAVEQYCGSEDSPTFPGYSDDETAAACDIIANSEDD
jgi:hypothetical protein